jgi:hypothetical protein
MRYIGDVHGKWGAYEAIAQRVDASIQVGDFGIGFGSEPPFLDPGHKFIRGNHDNPDKCQAYPNYMGDFGVYADRFWVGGGYSIDQWARTPGETWWPGEELSESVMAEVIDLYEARKPRLMITHMAPRSIESSLFHFPNDYPNRTHSFLEVLLKIHEPKIWIFGHYHRSVDSRKGGCRFICLDELAYIDID